MFKWYEAATVCFVHLADAELSSDGKPPSLLKCRWFKRGWCLQELLAPRALEFFDKSWKFLGTKIDLLVHVQLASGVEEPVLTQKTAISSVPVGRRMYWASERETTRPEDMAYCLLGIFQVNMPLLYGEGDRAFLRLQDEIIKNSNDMTLFAWNRPASWAPLRGLLAHSPKEFGLNDHSLDIPLLELPNPLFGGEFTSTNKGLFFKDKLLWYDNILGQYILPVRISESYIQGVYLEKFGPDMFVRVAPHVLASVAKTRVSRDVAKGMYVLKDVTPELERAVKKPVILRFIFKMPLVAEAQPGLSSEFWDRAKQCFNIIDLDSVGSLEFTVQVDGVNEEYAIVFRTSAYEDDLVAFVAVLVLPLSKWRRWQSRIREPPLEYDPLWAAFCEELGADLDTMLVSRTYLCSSAIISCELLAGEKPNELSWAGDWSKSRVIELDLKPRSGRQKVAKRVARFFASA
jgi:hypothetical protein